MNLFRTVFGNRADPLEEKGDDLKLHGFWREAAWFYGRALDSTPRKDESSRKRLELKTAEARRAAFHRILEEAEGLAESGRAPDAALLLEEAEPFALGLDERDILAARLGAWGAPAESAPSPALKESGEDPYAAPPSIDRLREAVAVKPESAAAHERLARALEKDGQYAEAIRHYEAAYQRDRDRVSLILEIVRVMRDGQGDGSGARVRIEEACRRHRPSSTTFLLHLERIFLLSEHGRDEDAIAGLGTLLNVPGLDRGVILFNRAGILDKVGRHGEAETDLLAALDVSPSHLYLERIADLVFRTTDDLDRALGYLDRALAADSHDFAVRGRAAGGSPDRARLQFKASRILYLLDRPGEARRRVDEGLIVCWDPRVEEALLDLRRELEGSAE